jgi:uncharacterized protein YjbI with pentapeptide repeats
VLEPYDLVREHDRLWTGLSTDPRRLEEPVWSAMREAVDRVRTVLCELAKFIPPGRPAVPGDAHRGQLGRDDQRARPERYARGWIDGQLAHWNGIARRFVDDAPRVFDQHPILRHELRPRGRLDEAALRAHAGWLERGGTGEGRLDVVTAYARGIVLDRADLRDCKLLGVVLSGASLHAAQLDRAQLVDVDLHAARLARATCTQARILRGGLDRVHLEQAALSGAWLESTSLVGCNARASRWELARLSACRLAGASLEQASLDHAVLVGCDLSRASLAGASLTGATLQRCDLRGASLVDCDLTGASLLGCTVAGIVGPPRAISGWRVVDADFSDAGNGGDLGDADDLAEELG